MHYFSSVSASEIMTGKVIYIQILNSNSRMKEFQAMGHSMIRTRDTRFLVSFETVRGLELTEKFGLGAVPYKE